MYCLYVHIKCIYINIYIQCNSDIRELSGLEKKSLISGLQYIYIYIIYI